MSLPAAGPQKVVELLRLIQANENDVRQEAEKLFTQFRRTEPDALVVSLLTILKTGEDVVVRQQAAVSLRLVVRHAVRDVAYAPAEREASTSGAEAGGSPTSPDAAKILEPGTVKLLQTELLTALGTETVKLLRKSICDVISDLAMRQDLMKDWPELTPAIMAPLQDPAGVNLRAASLRILADLIPQMADQLTSNAVAFGKVIKACADPSNDIDIRLEALNLSASLVQSSTRNVWRHARNALPAFIETLRACVKGPDDSAVEILTRFIEIGDTEPTFFSKHLTQYVRLLFEIMQSNDDVEAPECDENKEMAVEALLCLVDKRPSMCLKVPNFAQELIRVLMEFMLAMEQDSLWSNLERRGPSTDRDREDNHTRAYEIGEAGLDRAVSALGGENVMDIVFALVAQYLSHPEWQYKAVGIMAISQTVEYLPEAGLEQHLEEIVKMLLTHMQDPHHAVRYAACQAIAQISLDHQPLFQRQYATAVLPVLLTTLQDPIEAVRGHATSAFINFAEECDKADLLPYVEQLMSQFFTQLTNAPAPESELYASHVFAMEQAVTSIAVIAGATEKDFLKYYPNVMPVMKTLLRQPPPNDKSRGLRAKALECIGVVGSSVGAEVFAADAHDVMAAVLQLAQGGGISADDPLQEFIQSSLCRLCQTLKKGFLPYLQYFLPDLLKVVSQKPVVMSEDADLEDVQFELLEGGKLSGLKTSVISDMVNATWTVGTFVQTLGKDMGESLVLAAETFIPLISFPLSDELRGAALETMADIVLAYRGGTPEPDDADALTEEEKAKQKQELPPISPEEKAQLLQWMERILVIVLEKELAYEGKGPSDPRELPEQQKQAARLATCIRNAGPDLFSVETVYHICEKVLDLVTESLAMTQDIKSREGEEDDDYTDEDDEEQQHGSDKKGDGGHDDEENEDIVEKLSDQFLLRSSCLEIISALMQSHTAHFLQSAAKEVTDFMAANLEPTYGTDEFTIALYIADDILEHLKLVTHEEPVVMQAAAYGANQAARCSKFYPEMLKEAARQLCSVLGSPVAQIKKSRGAIDNVVAALGTIILRRNEVLEDPIACLSLFIANLPLQSDETEGRNIHSELVKLMLKRDPAVLGANDQNLPKLISICAGIYRTAFSSTSTDDGIRKFLSHVGFDVISKVGAGFERKLQQALERIHNDCVSATST